MQPRQIATQGGRWDGLVYTQPLGVPTDMVIKLELGYLGGLVQRDVIFQGSGDSDGTIELQSSSGGPGSMPALLVGN